MINANDLAKQQKEKEKTKHVIFNKIYEIIEKKIILASSFNYYYIVYEIPEFLIGYTLYSFEDCNKYINDKLKFNKFNVIFYEPNTLLISWDKI